jgi:hypothetical protein
MIGSYTVGTYGFGIKSRNIEERAVFFPGHYHLITTTFRLGILICEVVLKNSFYGTMILT